MALPFKNYKEHIDALIYTNNTLRHDVEDSRAAIIALKQERDALLKVREAADALAEDAKGYVAWAKEFDPEHDTYTLERRVKAYKEARDGRV